MRNFVAVNPACACAAVSSGHVSCRIAALDVAGARAVRPHAVADRTTVQLVDRHAELVTAQVVDGDAERGCSPGMLGRQPHVAVELARGDGVAAQDHLREVTD